MLSRVRDEDVVDDSTDVIDLIRAKWISQRVKVRLIFLPGVFAPRSNILLLIDCIFFSLLS